MAIRNYNYTIHYGNTTICTIKLRVCNVNHSVEICMSDALIYIKYLGSSVLV